MLKKKNIGFFKGIEDIKRKMIVILLKGDNL